MKYTPQLDNLINQSAHVLTQLANAYINFAIHNNLMTKPTNEEETKRLGNEIVIQMALLSITKITVDPEGLLYPSEIVPLLERVATSISVDVVEVCIDECIQEIISERPEGTPPPEATKEEEDPIIRAQQGKSSIIIPGVNDK